MNGSTCHSKYSTVVNGISLFCDKWNKPEYYINIAPTVNKPECDSGAFCWNCDELVEEEVEKAISRESAVSEGEADVDKSVVRPNEAGRQKRNQVNPGSKGRSKALGVQMGITFGRLSQIGNNFRRR